MSWMWWCLGSRQECIDFEVLKFNTESDSEYMKLSKCVLGCSSVCQSDGFKALVVASPEHGEA
jgi:hypothetical protein